MNDLAEVEQVRRIRAGDRDACAQMVHVHYEAVYRFLVRLSRDPHLAEDLTQETFVAAWRGVRELGAPASLRSWLHRIAYNKYIDVYRRDRRGQDMTIAVGNERRDLPVADPGEHIENEEAASRLEAAVESLDDKHRLVITLHYLQDLSFREMAEVLDEPTGTVKARTHEALNRLRARLAVGVNR
jgi:RNA polymerase sigma-70 factor (ECF subfamily)